MKIFSWSIINNEIDFIKDIVDYHLSWVDAMYILDTGSTDGTLEYLRSRAYRGSRIVLEEYPIKYVTQYEVPWHEMTAPFPEVTVRNYAINAVNKLNPDWIIQLDGDEIFTPITRELIEINNNHIALGHSTINPVCKLQEHPLEQRQGCYLYDPHTRVWKANQNIHYIANPAFQGKQYHCIPTFNNGTHLYNHPQIKFIDDPIHFHLHWMYGKKLESFYNKKGIFDKESIAKDQCINEYVNVLPDLFWERRSQWLSEGK